MNKKSMEEFVKENGTYMEEIHDFIIENMPGELSKETHEELKSILSQFY